MVVRLVTAFIGVAPLTDAEVARKYSFAYIAGILGQLRNASAAYSADQRGAIS